MELDVEGVTDYNLLKGGLGLQPCSVLSTVLMDSYRDSKVFPMGLWYGPLAPLKDAELWAAILTVVYNGYR